MYVYMNIYFYISHNYRKKAIYHWMELEIQNNLKINTLGTQPYY